MEAALLWKLGCGREGVEGRRRLSAHHRGLEGIVIGDLDVECEAAAFKGRAGRPLDEHPPRGEVRLGGKDVDALAAVNERGGGSYE